MCLYSRVSVYMWVPLCVCVILLLLCDAGSEERPSSQERGENWVPQGEETGQASLHTAAPGQAPSTQHAAHRWSYVGGPEVCVLSWGSAPKPSMTSGTLSRYRVLMCPEPQKPKPSGPLGSLMPEVLHKVGGKVGNFRQIFESPTFKNPWSSP